MVRRNDLYFYLSGAISFSLFGLIFVLFGWLVFGSDQVKSYALTKDKYIAVSVDLSKIPSPNDTKKPAPKPKIKPESAPDPAETPKSVPDVSSLFSEVWTKKVSPKEQEKKKREDDAKRLSAIERRIKTSTAKKSDTASKKLKELKLARPSAELVGKSGSSASEVNEYLAKIQAFVYERFFPPVNSEGNSAKIRIWLDASGRLTDYRIMARSGSSAFNDEVSRLEDRLESIAFPKNPDGRSIVIDIILTAKE